ncbi:GmrSD restriction endonuclease domain-containing protein, partial [Enterococcus faecalis]|uniref:GmrSD restriction endonuclease domain-containing protein n=1 Tax=Enterococcus faecalis TaxID=1351 RepID=UPI003D6B9516
FTVIARYQELYRKNLPNESVEKTSYIMNSLRTLHQMMEKDILAYYEENSQEIDKILDIFIRMNSGGTTLTYSDLLL